MNPPIGQPVVDGVPVALPAQPWRVVGTRFVLSIAAALLLCASLVCTLVDHDFSRPDAPVPPVRFASFLLKAWALVLLLFGEWVRMRKVLRTRTPQTPQMPQTPPQTPLEVRYAS